MFTARKKMTLKELKRAVSWPNKLINQISLKKINPTPVWLKHSSIFFSVFTLCETVRPSEIGPREVQMFFEIDGYQFTW